jgi:hypothetical protein
MKKTRGLYHVFERRYLNFSSHTFLKTYRADCSAKEPEKHDVDLLGPAGAEGRPNPTEPDPSSMAGTEAGTAEGGLVPSLNPTEPDPSSMAGTEAGTAEGGLVPSLNPTSPGCYTRNNLTIMPTFLKIAFTLKRYHQAVWRTARSARIYLHFLNQHKFPILSYTKIFSDTKFFFVSVFLQSFKRLTPLTFKKSVTVNV